MPIFIFKRLFVGSSGEEDGNEEQTWAFSPQVMTVIAIEEFPGYPNEKDSLRQLQRLYQNARKKIEDNVSVLIQREQNRLLEAKQKFIGWEPQKEIKRLG